MWTANYEEGVVVLVDPDTNHVSAEIPVRNVLGAGASDVHPIEDDVWLAANDSQTVGHVDADTMEVSVAAELKPAGMLDMAATSTEVWVAQQSGYEYAEPITVHGARIATANDRVRPPGDKWSVYSDIAAGDIGVWAIDESGGTLAAISPTAGEPRVAATEEKALRGAQADVAVGHGYVWVETSDGGSSEIARYDPSSEQIHSSSVRGEDGVMAIGDDVVWLLTHDEDHGYLWQVHPESGSAEQVLTLDGEFQSADISYGFGSVWITHDTNLLSRVDVTGQSPSEVPPSPEPRGDAEVCDQTGPWSYCPEARWLRRVVLEAGFDVTDDTGTALEVLARDRELHAWNTDATKPLNVIAAEEGYEPFGSSGAYTDGVRILWDAQGLHLYISAADTRPIRDLPEDVVDDLIAASRRVPMEADKSGARPQPTPTGEQRFEDVGGGKVRVWPVTEDVENSGKYLFTAPHCGLNWMIDFDGSFWDAKEPADFRDEPDAYPFFYNSDEGVITFTGDDTAVYQASTGETIELRRIEGPITVDLCD